MKIISDNALPPILIERNDTLDFEPIVTNDEGLDSNEDIDRGFSVLFLCFIVFENKIKHLSIKYIA
jgi:hypothetical protein